MNSNTFLKTTFLFFLFFALAFGSTGCGGSPEADIKNTSDNGKVTVANTDETNNIIHNVGYYLLRQDKQWGRKAVRTHEAWEYSIGNNNATVLVVDSGIDGNHLDLRDNFDAEHSKNFLPNTSDVSYEDTDFYDEYGHGTHAAGIIAAKGNNNFDIIGVNRNAKIISLRGCSVS